MQFMKSFKKLPEALFRNLSICMFSTLNLIKSAVNKTKFYTYISLAVFAASLLALVSLSVQPIAVKAQTANVSVADDVMIVSNQSGSQYFRDHVGAGYAFYSGSLGQAISLIKFNNPNLPAGAIVTGASINLKQYSHSILNAANPSLYASKIDANWNPSTATWANRPSFSNDGGTVSVGSGVRTFSLDATNAVRSWYTGGTNYGIAVRSSSTNNGSWLCSVRIVGPDGGSSFCNGFATSLSINYILNSPPNVPVLDSSLLSSNDAHGGLPYVGGIVRTNNLLDPNDDLKQDCVQNNGCKVQIRFTNFGDGDQAPGDYNLSEIILEPATPPGASLPVGISQNIYWPSTAEFNQTLDIKDGYYKVYAKSVDNIGAISYSNSTYLKVDTTAPVPAEIVTLPEFSVGDQLLVNSTNGGDVGGLSNPVKYDFCRTDGIDPSALTPFNAGTSATPTSSDFVRCSSTGADGIDPGATGNYQDSAFFGFGNLEDGKKYYFVVRNKDTVDASQPDRANIGQFSSAKSTIMDATIPVITGQTLIQDGQSIPATRISPINNDGIKDETNVKFDVDEANLDRVFYQLKNVQTGDVAATLGLFDSNAGLDKSTFNVGNNKSFNHIFKGQDENLQNLPDATYSVIINALDKAGNITKNEDLVISIDNTPGNINISLPSQNAFVNQNNFTISGQIMSGDDVSLEECQISSGNCNYQNLPFNNVVNQDYFFQKNYGLSLGENLFKFRSTDSVSNQQEKQLKITREEEIPSVTSVSLNSQNMDINGQTVLSNNRKPVVEFSLQDPNTQNNGVSGIDGNSLNLKLVDSTNGEISLVLNGANSSILGSLNSTCIDQIVPAGDFVTGQTSCDVGYNFANEIQPDGQYTFVLSGKDKAGNLFSYDKAKLNLDSFTFVENSSPSANSVYARKIVRFEGKGEKGATLKLENSQLKSAAPLANLGVETYSTQIVLDETSNGSLGQIVGSNPSVNLGNITPASYVQGPFTITCNEDQDFDNSALTTNPICSYSVDLPQSSSNDAANPNPEILNDNIITIADLAGNTQSLTKTIKVNLFSVNLSFAASNNAGKQYGTTFISTDGNGKQDGIYFEGAISNPNNAADPILVDTWSWTLKNSNGDVVKTISGSNSLPPSLIFDGKDDSGNWLEDGNYTWNLDLNSVDNSNLPNISGAFQNITKNTPGVFITYPSGASSNTPFITSSGVTEVQGQANLFAGLNPEDVSVRICVDTLGLNGSCDFEQMASVSADGYFSVIVALPKITSDPANPGITNHIIQATIVDKFGNEGLPSNQVFVRNNPVDPFISVQSIPTFSGINSVAQIAKIEDLQNQWLAASSQTEKDNIKTQLETEINSAKKLILRSTVTADTQYVKLSYSNLTNLSELSGNEVKQKIGWIDNSPFDYTKNILGDVTYNSAGDPLTTPCSSTECTWDVVYPVPSFNGGLYEVNFTGRKGSIEQTLSAGVWLDANILTTPTIYDINKIVAPSTSENTRLYNGKYYSNSLANEIKGFADPSTNIAIIDIISGNTVCQTVTSEISIFSCTLSTSTSNTNTNYSLKVVATKGVKTVESLENTALVVDTIAPSLVAYRNLNNNNSDAVNKHLCTKDNLTITNLPASPSIILGATPNGVYCNNGAGMPNGFNRQSGDTVEVELEADEVLEYGKITNQNEKFRYELSPVANSGSRPSNYTPYFAAGGLFQIEGYAAQGNYQVEVEIADLAGNITQTTKDYIIDNVGPNAPTQDFSLWGNLTGFERRIFAQPAYIEPSYFRPANNRLLQIDNQKNYVLKDDSVFFYGFAEKDTHPILSINNTDIVAVEVVNNGCSEQSKVNGNLVENQETIAADGTVVQNKTHCLFAIQVKFEELYQTLLKAGTLNTSTQGTKPGASSKAEGVYLVQWRNEDKSGNRSEHTRQYLLEYDKTVPQFFSIQNALSNKFNPLIDFQTDGAPKFYADGRGNLPVVTNQLDLTLEGITEQQADVEYFLLDNVGNLVSNQSKTFINATNQKHTVSFTLGSKTADKDGAAGLAEDGIYQICYNSADSADNEIGLKCFQIERDTLTPNNPNLNLSLNFVYKQEPYTISGNVSGESYTTSNLVGNIGKQGNKTSTVKTLSVHNDSDWENTFTFCSNLADRATNTSGNTCKSITTPVRPPRSGECNLSDSQKSTIKDYVKNLTDPNSPLPDLGFSKSCNVYEPNLIQSQVNDELQTQAKAKSEASSCVQANELNRLRKETNFVGPTPANKTCDTSLLTNDEIANIKTAYQDSIDNYKQAVADYEKQKAEIEAQQAKATAEAEKNKYNNDFNIFSGDNCFTKGVINGAASVVTGIADFTTGIIDDFKNGDYLSGIGKIALVVGVVALTIVAAPFVAGAVGAGLAVVGIGGTAGAIATTIITGAIIGATINTVSAAVSATNISFNPPSLSFDPDKFNQNLAQNFCGTTDPNPATCIGYFAGQVLTGEALAAGVGAISKGASSISKSSSVLDDVSKVAGTVDDLAKVTDDISKIVDDLSKATDNLNKNPTLPNMDDAANALNKAMDDLDNVKNGVDDTKTKPKNSEEPKGGCLLGKASAADLILGFVFGVVSVRADVDCATGFANENTLESHYNDHGADFGAKSSSQYQALAKSFMNSDNSSILSKTRINGDIVKFNPSTNEFGVVTSSGIIRTYYKPNPAIHGEPTNLDYYNKQ